MASTHVFSGAEVTTRPVPRSARRALLLRLPVAAVGLIGAAVLVYGVTQPWVTTFAGLLKQDGWGTRNGNLLVAGGVLAAVLALVQVVWANSAVRWLLALTGFAAAGFGGYLLIQLYSLAGQTDSMTILGKGPGLYISAAGAAIVFTTIFLPMPGTPADTGAESVQAPIDKVAVETPARPTTLASLLRAIGSPLRYPAALLAVVAGLAHVPVTPEHLQEAPYIGVSFIVLTIVCVIFASLLLISDSVAVWATIGVTCLLAVIAYVVSRTIGLPLMADDVGNWLETLGVVSVVTETGVAVLSVFALRRAWGRSHA